MIHPHTLLKFISEDIGYGVFAKQDIPKGTIVYVKDELEVAIHPSSHLLEDAYYREILEKYSYVDASGEYILSWDFGRFVNHSCNPNTLSTGYGFEIAIRDIAAGEEITDDYGMFNMQIAMECGCGTENCRKTISHSDFTALHPEWDNLAREAIMAINSVEQPLMHILDREVCNQLLTFLNTNMGYQSVNGLKTELHKQTKKPKSQNKQGKSVTVDIR